MDSQSVNTDTTNKPEEESSNPTTTKEETECKLGNTTKTPDNEDSAVNDKTETKELNTKDESGYEHLSSSDNLEREENDSKTQPIQERVTAKETVNKNYTNPSTSKEPTENEKNKTSDNDRRDNEDKPDETNKPEEQAETDNNKGPDNVPKEKNQGEAKESDVELDGDAVDSAAIEEEKDEIKNTDDIKSTSSQSTTTKRKRKKTVNSLVQKEVDSLLAKYVYEQRINAFDSRCTTTPESSSKANARSPKGVIVSQQPKYLTRAEQARLSRTANKTLKQLELDQIWRFHQLKIGAKEPKSPEKGFVQNYSRHVGSILQSVGYKQYYNELSVKKK